MYPLSRMRHFFIVVVTVTLLLATVGILNWKGILSPVSSASEIKDNEIVYEQKTLSKVSIAPFTADGSVLITKDKQLFTYSLNSKTVTPLITDAIVEYPGVLQDGRVYFWQKEEKVYPWLYIQNGESFDKYHIPLKEEDFGYGARSLPVVAPNGTYVLFLSGRDSLDNYDRSALYHYNLKSFALTKLTENKTMTVYSPFISPNSEFIGFTYQNFKPAKTADPMSLGLIIAGTITSNLYPKIIIESKPIAFSADSKYVLYTGSDGMEVFDISKGTITQTIKNTIFRTRDEVDKIIAEENTGKAAPFFLAQCRGKGDLVERPETAPLISIYQMEGGNLKKIQSIQQTDYLVSFSAVFMDDSYSSKYGAITADYQDIGHCSGSKGILHVQSSLIDTLPISRIESAFWPIVR